MNRSIPNEVHSKLLELAQHDRSASLIEKFQQQPDRVTDLVYTVDDLRLDLSKTHLSSELIDCYTEFASKISFTEKRADFLSGVKINRTEDRAVLHTLLRASNFDSLNLVDDELHNQAVQARQDFADQLTRIRQNLQGREIPVTDFVHIGIGGSALGTQLVYESLAEMNSQIKVHFVSNIDAHQLVDVLRQCRPESTLVFGISKTFTTSETLQNIRSVLSWLEGQVEEPLDSLIAVTANAEQAKKFGVKPDHVVTFPNWVGGRYSVWSSVSMSAAIAMAEGDFDEFLVGAANIDSHFASEPLTSNICFLAAALDHYYANYFAAGSRAIFAYDHRLRSLVPYLQQLETESNGKDRRQDGSSADQKTSPVIWGGVGTDVQHSVFQMLHQGTSVIPTDFILVAQPDHEHSEHHSALLANGVAQSAALLAGQTREEILHYEPDISGNELAVSAKQFSGNRPSSTIVLRRLTPRALGSLLAFYEHRTYCYGQLVDINSFDQMGVELGKRLAKSAASLMSEQPDDQSVTAGEPPFDPSTIATIEYLKSV
ncbi:MAG: glucose-6-phosphate isomerase [Pseudomonadota bacterium]